jgi:hypothetical protein
MYINTGNVESFLNDVHRRMIIKYSYLQLTDKENALTLQNFFQSLKLASIRQKMGLPITDNLSKIVLEILYQNHPKTNILFSVQGGSALEYDLANVIESIYMATGNINMNSSSDYVVGT